ncbi:hypothetical protein KY285_020600 [Solanum tuberosum]|nr:hypothetical protein KY285_020600 [Solanum tuberosum]
MLLDRNLPDHFWVEAVSTACHILNRCLIRPILKKTRYELWRGKKPNISYFHPFGCKCFIHNNGKNNLGKFNPRSDEVIDVQQTEDISQVSPVQSTEDIAKATLEPNTDKSATTEMESTTPVNKANIAREWRHNANYLENYILGKPNDKMQTRSSLRKQASVALISQNGTKTNK